MNDWNVLQYVLAIARNGGLSGAARALNVNHATVSRQLTRAEEEIGQPLFERLHTGLIPTDTGKIVIAHAQNLEAAVKSMDLDLAAQGAKGGQIILTIPPLLVTRALARDLGLFMQENPAIDLKILGDNRIFNLHQREADVAFRVMESPSESLWGRKVATQQSGYYGSKYLIRKLADNPGMAVPVISFTAWNGIVPDDFSTQFSTHEIVTTCDDMVAAIALLQAGIGATRMPYFLGQEVDGLELLPGQELKPYPSLWILTHPNLRKTPRIARFMAFMGKRIADRAHDYAQQ